MGVIKPIKLLLVSFSVWLFFYVQMPVRYLYNESALFPILTLFLFIISFLLGTYSLKSASLKKNEEVSNTKLKQIIFFFFCVGLVGVILKIYVGFFNTEIFVAESILEKRLENMGKELSGGAVSILASLLFPYSFISLLISIYNYKILNKFFLFFIVLVGLYPMIETFFMGGRTIIALLGTTLIFVLYASVCKNSSIQFIKIKLGKIKIIWLPKFLMQKKIVIPLILIVTGFTYYSVVVVNDRFTRFGYQDHIFEVMEGKDNKWVKFDKEFKVEYFKSSEEEKGKMIGIFSLKHYFVHGVIEYIRMVNHLDSVTGYYYGQYEFNVFFKFFKSLGLPLKSLSDLNEIISRKSVYKTFWGSFYIDFGVFGVFVMFFWGRFVKRLYVLTKRGCTQYAIFYGYLSTILITSFFINFILGSSSYYLLAFFINLLVFKFWPKNLVFSLKNE